MIKFSNIRVVDVRRGQLTGWLRRGLDVLFPPRCVACSQIGAWLCNDCIASVEPVPQPICQTCGRSSPSGMLCSLCRVTPICLDGVRSVALHTGALRTAIHHFKYQGRQELASILGEMLHAYWEGSDLPADLVIPVPLHAARQKERGFNQAGLLAAVLARRAQLSLSHVDLVRSRATAPQVGLSAVERKANVKDAFSWNGARLNGCRVLLIDDVCTTGATLNACAQALRRGGARSIWALTLARPVD
jgi:ComF family protein